MSDDKQKIKELEKEIEHLKSIAFKDELTQVLNRRGINDIFDEFFNEAKFLQENPEAKRNIRIEDFSVIFFDADNFKSINDTYGHDIGDKVLVSVAEIMSENVRGIDIVGRLGGEEFIVGLLGADEKEAFKKAEELRALISEIRFEENPDIKITTSVGVSSLRESKASSLTDLIGCADRAMYEAKNNRGKNNVVKCSELIE
ncbi:GGDEF domain-containing protein [Patescibacteria group bacterium]|nr:GGDEF domain-containing protein [Patescibacteria group bacterium]